MDVVTVYLYGSLDSDNYMRTPEGFKMPETYSHKSSGIYSIKLQWSLSGLKKYERMWYNHLSEYLLWEGYINKPICSFVFIKRV